MIRYLMWTSPSTVWQTRTSNQTRSYISSLSASLGKIIIIVVLVIIIIIIIIKLDCELYLWVSGHYSVRSANVSVVIKVIILIIILLIRSVPAAWLIFTLIVLLIYLLTRCHLQQQQHHLHHNDFSFRSVIIPDCKSDADTDPPTVSRCCDTKNNKKRKSRPIRS